MAEYLTNTTDLTKVAAAIREKGGTSDPLVYPDGFVTAIGNIQTGGTTPGAPGDITFYDYDGTIVTSWTLEELATKTALPDYPSHEGLTCQGWNWSLADLKSTNRKMNVGAMYITDDGKTRIYIRLEEGRTSPMLGVCPNGTVTVDWGDGTTPDTLTGTSTTISKWTPNHAYAAPGEYVIKLTVDGTMGFFGNSRINQYGAILRYSSSGDNRNTVYRNGVQKIEIGSGITSIGNHAFAYCYSLASIAIPSSVTSIGSTAFNKCYSLVSITIPGGVTSIGNTAFSNCDSLASIAIPSSVTSIGSTAFTSCHSFVSIRIPNGVTSIGNTAFNYCESLASLAIPGSVTSIGSEAFYYCDGVAFYDFNHHTSVPTLENTNAFNGISADCQIRVPASLVDTWKAATNWSTYADHIVGV
nr:MAG TPA: leucine-rich repeat protein [Caudoviricetes sp.]